MAPFFTDAGTKKAGLKKEGAEAPLIPSEPTRETYGEGCVAFGRAEAWGATEPANPTTVWSTYRDPPAPVSIFLWNSTPSSTSAAWPMFVERI